MRIYTETVREGTKVAEVDWGYDFRQHFNNYCTSDAGRDEICAKSVQRFREIADAFAAGKTVRATTYGGWPRCGYGEVLDVGMYDGWPYWKPVSSVFTRSVLGARRSLGLDLDNALLIENADADRPSAPEQAIEYGSTTRKP